MPELPEVQAHAERLTEAFAGAELSGFRALAFTALKTAAPDPGEAVGRPLARIWRRGKLLVLSLPAPGGTGRGADDRSFVVHLMQGGRLRPDDEQAARPRGGQARWTFADGRALLLTEAGTEHRAGVWAVAGDPLGQEPLDHLGPDADAVAADELGHLLAATSMRVHGFLRDQRQLAGLGRRLANEVCHRARLSPFATTSTLDGDQVARLHAAIGDCTAGSLAEERARDDMSSSKERSGAVHHRVGEACPVCGDEVRSVEYSAYTIAYCPHLPDRRQGPRRQHHVEVPEVAQPAAATASRRRGPGAQPPEGGGVGDGGRCPAVPHPGSTGSARGPCDHRRPKAVDQLEPRGPLSARRLTPGGPARRRCRAPRPARRRRRRCGRGRSRRRPGPGRSTSGHPSR